MNKRKLIQLDTWRGKDGLIHFYPETTGNGDVELVRSYQLACIYTFEHIYAYFSNRNDLGFVLY
jgi:hypothetical protein